MTFTELAKLTPLLLLLLLGAAAQAANRSSEPLTNPADESILSEAHSVTTQNFQYRRHEWAFASMKYAGFLQFFASNWRLVARLGGTYQYDGSPYYNRWSWEEALTNLVAYLDDLQRYYRVHRHLVERPDLLVQLRKRHPQQKQLFDAFAAFMTDRDSAGEQVPGYPGYLVGTGWRYQLLQRLAQPDCSGSLGDSVRQLLSSAHRIVSAAVNQTEIQLRHRTECSDSSDSLVAIATDYIELSQLAWDRMPGLAVDVQDRKSLCHAAGGNYSASNVTDAATWLSRQVLGHVLLYLRSLDQQQQQHQLNQSLTPTQSSALSNLYCRVVQEDIDKSLERHLETREMAELAQLLNTCRTVSPTVEAAYSQLESLWRSLRVEVWQEYSAFRQYSNRVPAILSAKSAAKAALPAVAAVGLSLNSLILAYFALNRPARQISRNLLIGLLAVFDSLILLTSCLVLFTDRYMEHDQDLKPSPAADLWCKFQAYLLNLTVESSAFIVVILSVERFLAVYSLFRRQRPDPEQPQAAHKELPRRKLSIMALCAFCFACIFNCMLIIGDEAAAPAKSTLGRQCVHYVRLQSFQSNLAYVTRVKPLLNALVRSLLPYSLVCLLSLATCWLLFKKGAYQSLQQHQAEETQQQQQQLHQRQQRIDQEAEAAAMDWNSDYQAPPGGQLNRALGQLGLACAYLVLTAPAPVVYTLFMTAHADRLLVRLTNGLYDEADPAFRVHWARIGRLTVAQYATEYVLVPLSAATVNFCALCLADAGFRRFLVKLTTAALCRLRRQPRQRLRQQQQQQPITADDWEQTEII